jgi:hypothetical protein
LEFREKRVILLVLQLENNYFFKNSFSLPSSRQGFVPLGLFLPNSLYSTILVLLGIFSVSVETLQDDLFVRYEAPFIVVKGLGFTRTWGKLTYSRRNQLVSTN